eukprot:gene2032-1482_t
MDSSGESPKVVAAAPVNSPTAILFLSDLPDNSDQYQIESMFQDFGDVFRVELCCDSLLNYGFVEMENIVEAFRAIDALQGTLYIDRPLSISWSIPFDLMPLVPPSGNQEPTGKVPMVQVLFSFICHQAQNPITEDFIASVFNPFGLLVNQMQQTQAAPSTSGFSPSDLPMLHTQSSSGDTEMDSQFSSRSMSPRPSPHISPRSSLNLPNYGPMDAAQLLQGHYAPQVAKAPLSHVEVRNLLFQLYGSQQHSNSGNNSVCDEKTGSSIPQLRTPMGAYQSQTHYNPQYLSSGASVSSTGSMSVSSRTGMSQAGSINGNGMEYTGTHSPRGASAYGGRPAYQPQYSQPVLDATMQENLAAAGGSFLNGLRMTTATNKGMTLDKGNSFHMDNDSVLSTPTTPGAYLSHHNSRNSMLSQDRTVSLHKLSSGQSVVSVGSQGNNSVGSYNSNGATSVGHSSVGQASVMSGSQQSMSGYHSVGHNSLGAPTVYGSQQQGNSAGSIGGHSSSSAPASFYHHHHQYNHPNGPQGPSQQSSAASASAAMSSSSFSGTSAPGASAAPHIRGSAYSGRANSMASSDRLQQAIRYGQPNQQPRSAQDYFSKVQQRQAEILELYRLQSQQKQAGDAQQS